jgi:hypothetical protein
MLNLVDFLSHLEMLVEINVLKLSYCQLSKKHTIVKLILTICCMY